VGTTEDSLHTPLMDCCMSIVAAGIGVARCAFLLGAGR
jgi:hypothetical protein